MQNGIYLRDAEGLVLPGEQLGKQTRLVGWEVWQQEGRKENTQQRGNCPRENVQGVRTGKLSPKCAAKLSVPGTVLRTSVTTDSSGSSLSSWWLTCTSTTTLGLLIVQGLHLSWYQHLRRLQGLRTWGFTSGSSCACLFFNPRIVATCTTLSNSDHCIIFFQATTLEELVWNN